MPEPTDLSELSHEAERLILTRVVERMKSPDLDDKAHRLMADIYCDVQKQSASRLRARVAERLLEFRMAKSREAETPKPLTRAEYHATMRQAVIDAYGDDFYPDYTHDAQGAESPATREGSPSIKTAHSARLTALGLAPPPDLIAFSPPPRTMPPDHPAHFITFPARASNSPNPCNIIPDTG